LVATSLAESLLQSSEEGWVISVNVLLGLCLGVKENTFWLIESEEDDFETACHTWIHVELVFELSFTEVGLDLADQINGVTAVASASTVLNLDDISGIFVALNFVGLLACLHSIKYLL
jgi:hypothetical protein